METGLRTISAGILQNPYTLLLRVEAIGLPTFGVLWYMGHDVPRDQSLTSGFGVLGLFLCRSVGFHVWRCRVLLGGSWVVISRVNYKSLIWIVTLLITPLITTHEPPSRGFWKLFGPVVLHIFLSCDVQGWALSLGHFPVGSYRYRSLIEGLCTL